MYVKLWRLVTEIKVGSLLLGKKMKSCFTFGKNFKQDISDQKRRQGYSKSTFTQAPCWVFNGNAILLSSILPERVGWAVSSCEVKCAHGQSCNNSYIAIFLLPSGCTSSFLDIAYVLSLPFVSALFSGSTLRGVFIRTFMSSFWTEPQTLLVNWQAADLAKQINALVQLSVCCCHFPPHVWSFLA